MSSRIQRWVFVILLLLGASPLWGGVWLHGIFADHMVLQQDAKVRVWGWADEGESVNVVPGWAPAEKSEITVGADRQWETWFETPKADGKSHALMVKGNDRAITINDIVLGELWLTGGQSNMAMGMSGWKDQPILGGPADIAKANYSLVRMFRFRNGHSRGRSNNVQEGAWTVCTPETAKRYSATGFYFAREIHLRTGCPVGFIHTAVGGVRIERWIRRHDLKSGPLYTGYEIERSQVRIVFHHGEGGLTAKGGKLKGFAIAGKDRRFVWAEAKIEGMTVVVRSDEIAAPVAVRYAWDMDPDCTLYNAAGLPASPFRTDNWRRSIAE